MQIIRVDRVSLRENKTTNSWTPIPLREVQTLIYISRYI